MRKWLGIVLAVVLGGAAWVSAHTVTIGDADLTDWDPAGWSMDRPTNLNTGHIARDSAYHGEYIWNDFLDDERTGGLAYPYPRLDIDEFRITSDSSYLYFLVRMNQINPGDWGVHGSPMVQIAIDLDPNWTGVTENGLGEFWSDQEATVAPKRYGIIWWLPASEAIRPSRTCFSGMIHGLITAPPRPGKQSLPVLTTPSRSKSPGALSGEFPRFHSLLPW